MIRMISFSELEPNSLEFLRIKLIIFQNLTYQTYHSNQTYHSKHFYHTCLTYQTYQTYHFYHTSFFI